MLSIWTGLPAFGRARCPKQVLRPVGREWSGRPSPGTGHTPIWLARSSRAETEGRGAEPELVAIRMQRHRKIG